jgi:hypothetical protein
VLTREDEHLVIILCIYVDDAITVGNCTAIVKPIAELATNILLKDVRPFSEYECCTVLNNPHIQTL